MFPNTNDLINLLGAVDAKGNRPEVYVILSSGCPLRRRVNETSKVPESIGIRRAERNFSRSSVLESRCSSKCSCPGTLRICVDSYSEQEQSRLSILQPIYMARVQRSGGTMVQWPQRASLLTEPEYSTRTTPRRHPTAMISSHIWHANSC